MAQYSALRHLGYAIQGHRFNPTANLFCMFAAYFDESGTAKDPHALTVAGGVSSITKWLRLEKEWRELLNSRNINVFHMSECAHGQRSFKGWSGNDRRDFVADLGNCIKRHVKRGLAVTIILSDWRKVDANFQVSEKLISPYVHASRLCVGSVRRWLKRSKITAPVEYVFEDGVCDKGKLLDAMSAAERIHPIFKSKDLAQLQVADLIAWKTRRVLHDLVDKPFTMSREQYESSLSAIRSIPGEYAVVDEEKLILACQRFHIPRRRV